MIAVMVTWEGYGTFSDPYSCPKAGTLGFDKYTYSMTCDKVCGSWKEHEEKFLTIEEARAFKALAPKDKTRNWKFKDVR